MFPYIALFVTRSGQLILRHTVYTRLAWLHTSGVIFPAALCSTCSVSGTLVCHFGLVLRYPKGAQKEQ